MKGHIFLYAKIEERMKTNMNWEKYNLKTYFFTFIFWTEISKLLSHPQVCNFDVLLKRSI